MFLKYVGNDKFVMKKDQKQILIKNGVEIEFSEDEAKEFSKRETNGEKDWIAATKETPKKSKKKGEE